MSERYIWTEEDILFLREYCLSSRTITSLESLNVWGYLIENWTSIAIPSEGDPDTYGDPSLKVNVCKTFPVFPSVFFGIPTQNLKVSTDFSGMGTLGGTAAASVVVVIEELALLATVDSVSGGGRGSDA